MDTFVLSSDSSCDEYKSDLRKRRIRCVPLTFTIDGVTYDDDFDSNEQYAQFYLRLKEKKMPTTSQITAFQHEEYFNAILADGAKEIVHITLSSGLSNTYNSAVMGAQSAMDAHPGSKIFVVDSLGATQGQRLLVDEGERLREAGFSAKEAAKALNEIAAQVHHWILVHDLHHLKRGGRVSAASAYIGSVLKIKPVLIINDEGKLAVVHKAKGVKNGLKYFLDRFQEYGVDHAAQTVYLASADADDLAQECKTMLQDRFGCTVKIGWIGPVIGAHTGGGTLGFVFRARRRLDKK